MNTDRPWRRDGCRNDPPGYRVLSAKTVIVVPRIGNRPRPNLEHMILHTMLVAAGVATLAYAAGL